MLYYLLRPFAWVALRIFFRKIYYHNEKVIPKGRPIIFALNHPTAFMETAILGAHVPMATHFMLRGDLFNNSFFSFLLYQLKTIPVYRFRDGYKSLKKNQDTFDYCFSLLNQQKHIIILSEGQMWHEKKLRPIQKGTARMAMGAYDKHGRSDICILPVGINYTDSVRFRSEAMIEFGEPIFIEDYLEEYEEKPRRVIKKLTDEIKRQLSLRVVHINEDEDAPFVERLLEINRNAKVESFLPLLVDNASWMYEEVRIAKTINEMEAEEKTSLRQKTESYFEELKQNSIHDFGLMQTQHFNVKNTLILILGFIPFLIGCIGSFLPVFLAKKIADHQVTKRMEFYSSIWFGVMMVSYIFYFLGLLIWSFSLGQLWMLVLVLLIPFLSFWSLYYVDVFMKWSRAKKARNLNKTTKNDLLKKRKELFVA